MEKMVVEQIVADHKGGVSQGYLFMNDGTGFEFADVVTFAPGGDLKIRVMNRSFCRSVKNGSGKDRRKPISRDGRKEPELPLRLFLLLETEGLPPHEAVRNLR